MEKLRIRPKISAGQAEYRKYSQVQIPNNTGRYDKIQFVTDQFPLFTLHNLRLLPDQAVPKLSIDKQKFAV